MYNNDIFKNAYLSSLSIIKEDIDPAVTGDEAEEKLMKVTFVTSDAALIETLNAGIEEVVFRVKDEEAADSEAAGYSEVIFSPASFGGLEIEEAELDEESDDVAEECGDSLVEEDEEVVEEEDEAPIEEDDDKESEKDDGEDDGEESEDEDTEVETECVNKNNLLYRAQRFSKYGY